MIKLRYLLLAFSLVFIYFLLPLNTFAEEEEFMNIPPGEPIYNNNQIPEPDGVIIKFRENVSEEQKRIIYQKLNKTGRSSLNFKNLERLDTGSEEELIKIQTDSKNYPEIEYVEPDYYMQYYQTAINDPLYSSQWYLAKIQAPAAWNLVKANGVKIAIIDSGIALNHPDISSKVIERSGIVANPHATHVACIAAGISGNGFGIAGISPTSKVMSIGVGTKAGFINMSSAIEGVKWAADSGAKVINMSWGGPKSTNGLKEAVAYAWSKDVVLVAAAGNDGRGNANFPASYPHVVSVAATDPRDKLAFFSTRGSWVTIAAPGVSINSCVPETGFKSYDGTSMASPVVAGVVALIRTGFPNFSNQQAVDKLCSTADRITGTGSQFSCGRVNAAKALAGAIQPGSGTGSGSGGGTSTPKPTSRTIKILTRFQGINLKGKDQKVKISIMRGYSTIFSGYITATSDTRGVYTLNVTTPIIANGIYDVVIKSPSHLQKRVKNVTITTTNNSIDLSTQETQQLKAGDVTGDNKISIEDVSLLLKYYQNFSVPVNYSDSQMEAADITKDGFVTIQDIALIAINWSDFTIQGD